MRLRFTTTLVAVVAACLCWGRGSTFASQPGQAASAAAGHEQGVLLVELAKSLNSKNLKPGAPVEATVNVRTNGMSIPRGSKVIGHVTEVKSHSKGDTDSTLGIVFDTIKPPAGASPASIKGVIKAVGPNPNSAPDTGAGGMGYHNLNEVATKSAETGQSSATPLLNAESSGVLGIKNLQLGDDGVLTSTGKEIKLESGTQVLLNVTMQ